MSGIDWGILSLYMIGVMAIGVWSGKGSTDDKDYFQGGRSLPWFAVAISVGMTRLSAGGFIGAPGWSFRDGLLAGGVMFALPMALLFATYTILPIIYNSGVTTIGEFLKLRFGNKTRILVIIVWLINSLVLIGGFVYTPALVLEAVTGVGFDVWVPLIVIISIIYTIIGGIKAVVWTDTVQGVVLSVGVMIAFAVGMNAMGLSFTDLLETVGEADLTTSFVTEFNFSNMNIVTAMVAGFMCWVSYFGFNQEQVQRYVTAKNFRDVKKTSILSIIIMQGVYWICYFLGMALNVFYQKNPATLDLTNVNNVFIDFIINHCPVGLIGVLLACVFAAAMSSLDSVLNSATAVFVKDIYEPFFAKGKKTTLKQSMIFTVIIGIVVVIFVYLYLGDSIGAITEVIAAMGAPFQGVLSGIMLCTLFFKSVNDKGCAVGGGAALVTAFIFQQYVASGLGMHWAWAYVYSALLAIILPILFSLVFSSSKEEIEVGYNHTVMGARALLGNQKDEHGSYLAPLHLDRYAFIIIAMFAAHMLFLAWVQTF